MVVNLLRRAVVVRVGQFAQPRCIQLIVVCHNLYLFIGLIILFVHSLPRGGRRTALRGRFSPRGGRRTALQGRFSPRGGFRTVVRGRFMPRGGFRAILRGRFSPREGFRTGGYSGGGGERERRAACRAPWRAGVALRGLSLASQSVRHLVSSPLPMHRRCPARGREEGGRRPLAGAFGAALRGLSLASQSVRHLVS